MQPVYHYHYFSEDEKLGEIVAAIKALPNVREIDNQADTYKTLLEMGIRPRTEFTESNKNILTHVQEDNGKTYIFVYNMQYTETEPFSFNMKVHREGSVYVIDCWNAEIAKIGQYKRETGCTTLDISLPPGEARMYMLDQNEPDYVYATESDADYVLKEDQEIYACASRTGKYDFELSDGTKKSVSVNVPDELLLSGWTLEVESWDEGDKKETTEDRGLGIVTKEVYYETKKDLISVGTTTLKSWKDIEAVGPDTARVRQARIWRRCSISTLQFRITGLQVRLK